jgi:hypothetical protein
MTITTFRLCIFHAFFIAPYLTCFLSNPATADIYKCPKADGSVAFSDSVCSDGTTEAVTLQSNNLMDSSVERQNIVNYHQQKQASRHNNSAPQVFLIVDSQAEERNARIGDQTASQTHQKKPKAKKRSKSNKTKKGKKKKQKKTDSR